MSFGIANNVRSKVRVCTPDLFNQALDSPQVAKTCAEIEDALEDCRNGGLAKEEYETLKAELKKRLPIFTFHATFPNGRRKNDDAVPSGLSIYDLDHIPNPREKWAEIEPRRDELGILLSHISPSLEGLRLVFVMPQGMDLAQAQAWMARELGDKEYDACVKDHARCSFAVPREYVLFMDVDALFSPRSTQSSTECFKSPTDGIQDENKEKLCDTPCDSVVKEETSSYPESFKNTPYATIIQEWFKRNGGEPEVGERNSKLHKLASHLRYITDNDEEHLLQIIPNFGLKEEEMKQLIHSACIAKFYGIPKSLQKLLKDLQSDSGQEEELEIINHNSDIDTPPAMPKKLPPLIKLLVSKTPKIYQPAVAHAVFPALGAYLWKTYFRYVDNVLHEATLMNVLMAGTGAGKSCTSEPIRRIMQDIRERDSQNLRQEREWKEEVQTKGANKDKRKRPKVCVQYIDADMTNAAFVQRMADADGRFLYTSVNEIDLFNNLQSSPRSGSQFQIMCLAFDPGNEYGQTRVGTQSVSEKICIRYNWNASTTIKKGQEYFSSVLTDGPISRINFCTIPERPIGASMPVYGEYDDAYDDELRTYIDRLNTACGEVVCKPARKLARKLAEECARQAVLSQNRAYENLSFRANVIAYLKACILYVAHGEKWDKSIEDFVRWSLHYDLWCKMQFFGDAIEREMSTPRTKPQRGPQNLLSLLPDTFTRQQAADLRIQQGIRTGTLKGMLGNWKSRGYIEEVSKAPDGNIGAQLFAKTEDYLQNRA